MLYAGPRLTLAIGDDPAVGAVDPVNTILQVAILLGSALYAAMHPREVTRRLLPLLPFLLLVALAMASATWSQSPTHSLRRSLSFGTLVLFVLFADAAFGPRGVMRMVVRVMLGLSLASLLLAVVWPAVGFDTGEYANAIRGVFPQKNGFGLALLQMVLALGFLALDRGRLVWRDAWLLGFALLALVLSRSTTALMLTLLVAAGTVGLLWIDRGRTWRLAALLLAGGGLLVVLLVLGSGNVQAVYDLLGKDSTLTGRVYIWEGVWAAVAQRPWLGHGYSAFWLPDTPGAEAIWRVMYWQVGSAHNGYLDVLLQLGRLGGVLVVGLMGWTVLRALLALRDLRRRRALWLLMFMGVLAVYNYSESALLQLELFLVFWLLGSLMLSSRPVVVARPPRPVARGLFAPRMVQPRRAGFEG